MRDDYAAIAWCYDAVVEPFLRPARRAVAALMLARGWRRAVDVCCGTGMQGAILAAHGLACLGVDRSPSMLRRAAARQGGSFQATLADAARLPLGDGACDVAVLAMCLHEMDPATRLPVLAEATRCAPFLALLDYDFSPPSPRTRALRAPLLRVLAHIPERLAGARHHACFKDYLARGGMEGLLAEAGLEAMERRRFPSGMLGGGMLGGDMLGGGMLGLVLARPGQRG